MDALALGAEDAEELHGAVVGVAEPVREVGVELGDLALGEDEVPVAEDDAEPPPILDSTWNVLVNETRPRTTPVPAGTDHAPDAVLRARRMP